jgi:hypothetical protein
MSLQSSGWFLMMGCCAVAAIGAGLEEYYIAAVCYAVATSIATYFTFITAQEDTEE